MNINWDAKGYKENFSFVHEYGEDVVSLLKQVRFELSVKESKGSCCA